VSATPPRPRADRARTSRRLVVASGLILLLILAFYLRFEQLVDREIGIEGELSHLLAGAAPTFAETYERSRSFAHPPLPFLLIHLLLLNGTSLLHFRLIALVPGLLLIPLMFQMGRLATGIAGGFFLAVVAAAGYASVQLSTEVRGYTLFMSLWSAAFCCLLQWERTRKTRLLAWYFFLCALSLLSHFTAAILIAGAGIGWAGKLLAEKRRTGLLWLLGHLALLLLFAMLWRSSQFGYSIVPPNQSVNPFESLLLACEYFFNPPFYRWQIVPILSLLGLVSILRRRKYHLLAFCVFGILFFLVSNYFWEISASGLHRRGWYLFPVAMLPAAFAFEGFWNSWSRLSARTANVFEPLGVGMPTVRLLCLVLPLIPLAWIVVTPAKWRGYDHWGQLNVQDVETIVDYLEESLGEHDTAFVAQWHNIYFVRYQQLVRREHSELFARVEQCSLDGEAWGREPAELHSMFLECLKLQEDKLRTREARDARIFFLTLGRSWTAQFAKLLSAPRTPQGIKAQRGLECLLRTRTAALYQWKGSDLFHEVPPEDPSRPPRRCRRTL
jgi:hypothetical protein